jgi:hypothetical protein
LKVFYSKQNKRLEIFMNFSDSGKELESVFFQIWPMFALCNTDSTGSCIECKNKISLFMEGIR